MHRAGATSEAAFQLRPLQHRSVAPRPRRPRPSRSGPRTGAETGLGSAHRRSKAGGAGSGTRCGPRTLRRIPRGKSMTAICSPVWRDQASIIVAPLITAGMGGMQAESIARCRFWWHPAPPGAPSPPGTPASGASFPRASPLSPAASTGTTLSSPLARRSPATTSSSTATSCPRALNCGRSPMTRMRLPGHRSGIFSSATPRKPSSGWRTPRRAPGGRRCLPANRSRRPTPPALPSPKRRSSTR